MYIYVYIRDKEEQENNVFIHHMPCSLASSTTKNVF